MQVDVCAVVRHPFDRQPGLHHGVAERVDKLLVYGQQVVNKHEEILAMRGVAVSYETVREWCLKFGQTYANGLRRKSPRPGDRWYLDEVFLKINGRLHYLWRAVDQDGDALDILVQRRRDKKAAKK